MSVVWNRLEDNCCVNCGNPLISPKDAELSMCTSCQKESIQAAKKQIKNRKSRSGNVKRIKMRVNPAFVFHKDK